MARVEIRVLVVAVVPSLHADRRSRSAARGGVTVAILVLGDVLTDALQSAAFTDSTVWGAG